LKAFDYFLNPTTRLWRYSAIIKYALQASGWCRIRELCLSDDQAGGRVIRRGLAY